VVAEDQIVKNVSRHQRPIREPCSAHPPQDLAKVDGGLFEPRDRFHQSIPNGGMVSDSMSPFKYFIAAAVIGPIT
jgi:hypothetical protein